MIRPVLALSLFVVATATAVAADTDNAQQFLTCPIRTKGDMEKRDAYIVIEPAALTFQIGLDETVYKPDKETALRRFFVSTTDDGRGLLVSRIPDGDGRLDVWTLSHQPAGATAIADLYKCLPRDRLF